MTSKIKIVLRNPLKHSDQMDYTIESFDHELGRDWVTAHKSLLQSNKLLEKNYCFMGFPMTARDLDYLCGQLNQSIAIINNSFPDYQIIEEYTPETVVDPMDDYGPNHEVLNVLHNHFERLQGTVWNLSDWYKKGDYETKYAIRQLNNICHEIENLVRSQRKLRTMPRWVRPSQITTWLLADRYELKPEHREGFGTNSYDRVLGGVYMHWAQIGKTLYEVFRDEGAPKLNVGADPTDISIGSGTTCEAITALKYYSGEFDVEWGNNVVAGGLAPWHDADQEAFRNWLSDNGLDWKNNDLSLGYLPIGQVNLREAFGSEDGQEVWGILGNYLDIYKIEVDGISQTYEYCWSDTDYKVMQIDMLKPGYDYQRRTTK
jgi:hypothetical protein